MPGSVIIILYHFLVIIFYHLFIGSRVIVEGTYPIKAHQINVGSRKPLGAESGRTNKLNPRIRRRTGTFLQIGEMRVLPLLSDKKKYLIYWSPFCWNDSTGRLRANMLNPSNTHACPQHVPCLDPQAIVDELMANAARQGMYKCWWG